MKKIMRCEETACKHKKKCGKESEKGFLCTRSAKHKGAHIACGASHNIQIWHTAK